MILGNRFIDRNLFHLLNDLSGSALYDATVEIGTYRGDCNKQALKKKNSALAIISVQSALPVMTRLFLMILIM